MVSESEALKPHSELPYAEGEEFMEVVSLDRGAGVRLVQEGRSSSTSGPAAMPEDVEESAPVKKLVAPSAPTADDREEHTASGHAVFRTWCRECCIGRGGMHQHRAGGTKIANPAIAIDNGYLNDRRRQDLRFGSASVIVIAGLARPLVQMSMRLLNSRTM